MYSIGNVVIYTTYGICRIEDLITKEFNGEKKQYYILKPLHDSKSSISIQADNPIAISKLRNLLTKDEILDFIHTFPKIEPYWIDNDNERKKEFSQILRNGTRQEVIALMKSVTEHSKGLKEKGRKLHASDEQCYKDAEKIINEEIAYVLDIDKKLVPEFITSEIESVYEK